MASGMLTILWVVLASGTGFWFEVSFSVCFVVQVLISVIAIIGGFAAVMRRLLPLAVLGAVMSMISIAFFGVSFILGLIGLIFIAISHSAFRPTIAHVETYRY